MREELNRISQTTDDIINTVADLAEAVKLNAVQVGYAGMRFDSADGPVRPLPNIGTVNWVEIDVFEFETGPGLARNASVDVPTGRMVFEIGGQWYQSFFLSMRFNAVPADDKLGVRIYNYTIDDPGITIFDWVINNGTDRVTVMISAFGQIPDAELGDSFGVQIKSTVNTLSNVSCIGTRWQAHHNSEFVEDLISARQLQS